MSEEKSTTIPSEFRQIENALRDTIFLRRYGRAKRSWPFFYARTAIRRALNVGAKTTVPPFTPIIFYPRDKRTGDKNATRFFGCHPGDGNRRLEPSPDRSEF